MDPNFEPLRSIGFNDHDPAKVPKFKYRHDCALSIRNFALNQAQLIISHTCQLTANQKMCSLLPWYTEFPIYLDTNMRQVYTRRTSASDFLSYSLSLNTNMGAKDFQKWQKMSKNYVTRTIFGPVWLPLSHSVSEGHANRFGSVLTIFTLFRHRYKTKFISSKQWSLIKLSRNNFKKNK
jgi:hypothetical protein